MEIKMRIYMEGGFTSALRMTDSVSTFSANVSDEYFEIGITGP